MKNYLSVLAFVKTHVDSGKTIWEALYSLIANLIIKQKISIITTEILCKEFADYYGYVIPLHPMNEIINRMRKNNYLHIIEMELIPNKKELNQIIADDNKHEVFYHRLIKNIISYFNSEYSIPITEDDVETLLIKFLDEFDVDFLSTLNISSIVPETNYNNEYYYILNKYLIKNYSNHTSMNEFINLVIANICVNSIFFSKVDKKINLSKTFAYLDTRIILRLSGVEGEFRKSEYIALIELMQSCKCKLRLFSLHYNEVLGILDDCVYWLKNRERYKSRYASPALRFFFKKNYETSDVMIFKENIDKILDKYSIKIENTDYSNASNQFLIDEKKLFDIIVNEYKTHNCSFEETSKENIIWNDVKAISAIFRKRKGLKPNSLKKMTHVFLTTNNALAKSSRKYLLSENNEYYQYQECMTDTFYASNLWLNTATKNDNYLRKKIIANAMSYLELNPEIIRKYRHKLSELHNRNDIDEDTFFFLRSHHIPLDLLKDKTFNIEDNYSDKLPEEILGEIRSSIEDPLKNKLLEVTKSSKELTDNENLRIKNINLFISNKSKSTARFYTFIIFMPFLIINLVSVFSDLIPTTIKITFGIISFFIASFLAYTGFSINSITKKIYLWKYNKLNKKINNQ